MKLSRKVPPLKLEAEVEREFYESSITFVGRPRRVVAPESSYNMQGAPRLQRGQVTFQLPEVLLTLGILAMALAFPIMIGMRGRFTPLKFEPPTRYGSSEPQVTEPQAEQTKATLQDPLTILR
jgi:hypothetical protein